MIAKLAQSMYLVGRPSPESMESLRQLYAVERTIKPLNFGPALKPTEVQ